MKKDPHLKFKYINGLGDLIACILHSKLIGWFTVLITGKEKPCKTCSKRIVALNVLFPFKMWKFFFKTIDQYIDSLYLDLKDYGVSVEILEKEKERILVEYHNQVTSKQEENNFKKENKKVNDLKLISTNKVQLDGYLIKTEIYKY